MRLLPALLCCCVLLTACTKDEAAPAATAPPTAPDATAAPATTTVDTAWLHGTWALTHDPDNSPKDWLTFSAGGALQVRGSAGEDVRGTWRVDGDAVHCTVTMNGRTITIVMTASADRTRLSNDSGAYYTKE